MNKKPFKKDDTVTSRFMGGTWKIIKCWKSRDLTNTGYKGKEQYLVKVEKYIRVVDVVNAGHFKKKKLK